MPDSVFFIYLFLLEKKKSLVGAAWNRIAGEGYDLIVRKKTQPV